MTKIPRFKSLSKNIDKLSYESLKNFKATDPEEFLEVEYSYAPNPKNVVTYSTVEFDRDGWANAKKYKPRRFDLVLLTNGNFIKYGWWDGRKWTGSRISEDDSIIAWKRDRDIDGY